jgi:hypothetical protein
MGLLPISVNIPYVVENEYQDTQRMVGTISMFRFIHDTIAGTLQSLRLNGQGSLHSRYPTCQLVTGCVI